MTYSIIVRFDRELGDDEEIALERFPDCNLKEALIEQFRLELQSAYDEGNIAGLFEIVGYTSGSEKMFEKEASRLTKELNELKKRNKEEIFRNI